MEPRKLPESLIAIAETLAALAVCVLVSLVGGVILMLLLLSPGYRAEYQLIPRAERQEVAAPIGEVARDVEALGLAPDVETREAGEGVRLVLDGLDSTDFPQDRLFEVLAAAGYRVGDLSVRRSISPSQILDKLAIPFLTLQAAIFLLAGALLSRFRAPRLPGEKRWGHAAAILLGAGAGVGAFAASMLLGRLLQILGMPVHEQEWVLDLLSDRSRLFRLAPWIVLIVPVSEEVFFRGYMFRLLTLRSGAAVGFLLSSLVFAVVHLNPSGLPVYFTIGIVLAFAYFRTGNLLAPIAAHVAHNSIVLIGAIYLPLAH